LAHCDPARLEDRIRRIVGVVEAAFSSAVPIRLRRRSRAAVHRSTVPRPSRHAPVLVSWVCRRGQTTIGPGTGGRLGWPSRRATRLHPEANVAKMHAGVPLTDEDRRPWLERVAAWIDGQRAKKHPGIITCSDAQTRLSSDNSSGSAGSPAGLSAQRQTYRRTFWRPQRPLHAVAVQADR